MKKIERPAPVRFGPFRTLLVAVPFGLASVGQAAAESRPEPDARVAAVSSAEAGIQSAVQPGRERMARRFERGTVIRERRTRHRGRREGRREGRRDARRDSRRDSRVDQAGRWFGRRAAAALDLTDEQRDQMRQAMREIGDNRRDSRREIADARRSFRQAARDSERTAAEIQTLGEALGKAQADAVVRGRADRDRLAGILTAEQRERLAQMRQNRGERVRPERRNQPEARSRRGARRN